ncbi:hypothetical protein [Ruegeria sp. HKCCD7559]|uniref:hypothetical protein n=1 Tax=Ruegeria sp. HKCCD7559 TaxID=2683005 RepID=UPI0014912A16|nr:hypothetical protein [Ruegeria sp. HKCCD7559]NOC46367.1 hypothetical protein [Ruegeria sp. HKCCD7559]
MSGNEFQNWNSGENPENLELVHWMDLDEWEARKKQPIENMYQTFADAADAIDEFGPIEIHTSRANAYFWRTSGQFEDDIIAVRQSGLNVRRILIRADSFEDTYGNFANCIDHVLSDNAIGPEVEYAHLMGWAKGLSLDVEEFDPERDYSRTEIEAVAALQLLKIRDQMLEAEPEEEGYINFIFDLGFTAGRAFSALQSTVYLEPNARAAIETKQKYIEKGLKSGSAERRRKRLEQFIQEVEHVFSANEAVRDYEDIVLRLAFDRVVPPGAYGHGQFDNYCSALRSESPYKERFDDLFRKSLK